MNKRYALGLGAATITAVMAAGLTLGQAQAPIVFSAGVAITGPSASLGAIEGRTLELLEKRTNAAGGIAGRPIKINVYDTGSDAQKAVLNVRKGIIEDRAVGIICCTTTPESLAVTDTAQRAKVPLVSMAASAVIVEPVNQKFWVFKTPPPDRVMVRAEMDDMKRRGFKRVAFIGFADSYGEGGYNEFAKYASRAGIEIVANEKFARTDPDTSAQSLRILSAKPDAVLIWATPPGAVTAHKGLLDAGFKGQIYQSYGVTNPSFLDLGSKIGANGVNGTIISALAIAIYDQLPSSLSYKPSIDAYVKAYRAENGGATPTSFGGHAWDAGTIFIEATKRAIAKGGNPADLEPFRASLRDEIEGLRGFRGISGVFNFSKADHNGLGPSTANMITVQNGQYRLLKR